MSKILITGERLKLRCAEISDLQYIMELQHKPENVKFIVPFDEKYHTAIINSDNYSKMDVIAEEIATGKSVGYFMLCNLYGSSVEIRHGIIDKKGVGYGREAFKLLMKWSFEIKKFHRVWFDCKTYNERALHLYETLGFKHEGISRECIFFNGVYEDLINLSILDREYFSMTSGKV